MARILSIIPYQFYPPIYGGALRCFYILREMARYHEVWLLTVQPEEDFRREQDPAFPENVRVVSTAGKEGYRTIFNVFPDRVANAVNSRILKQSILEKGNLYLLKTFPTLKRLLTENSFDLVHYENLECFDILQKHVRRFAPQTLHIYDAHNVDSELWLQLHKTEAKPELKNYAEAALAVEKHLYKTVSLCFACSGVDKQKLEKLNAGLLKIQVIPNGVDTDSRRYDTNREKHSISNILFCGTLDYAPNMRGVIWFYENVFPLVKKERNDLTFTIVGKMNTPGLYEKLQADPAVRFIGPVESVQPYYRESSLLVVPLLNGSGTRLKILEAMGMGSPVVSTSVGAEGLELENGNQIMLADDPVSFAAAIVKLLANKELFERLRKEAHAFVKRTYDWKVIGKRMNREINTVLNEAKKKQHVRLD
jgi:polysaccharide biosynthesis protein PslH